MTQPAGAWKPYFWTIAFILWMGFAMVAVAGGILRVVLLQPRLGAFTANVVETLALAALLLALMWPAVPWLIPGRERHRLSALGAFWIVLTIGFEFLFGHFVDGASWSTLLANYDVSAGRLWILIPLCMGLGPLLIAKVSRKGESPVREDQDGSRPVLTRPLSDA